MSESDFTQKDSPIELGLKLFDCLTSSGTDSSTPPVSPERLSSCSCSLCLCGYSLPVTYAS